MNYFHFFINIFLDAWFLYMPFVILLAICFCCCSSSLASERDERLFEGDIPLLNYVTSNEIKIPIHTIYSMRSIEQEFKSSVENITNSSKLINITPLIIDSMSVKITCFLQINYLYLLRTSFLIMPVSLLFMREMKIVNNSE